MTCFVVSGRSGSVHERHILLLAECDGMQGQRGQSDGLQDRHHFSGDQLQVLQVVKVHQL
jgi:hypothetical protein